MKDLVKTLMEKAAKSHDSEDALRFAQAAQHVANAALTLAALKAQ